MDLNKIFRIANNSGRFNLRSEMVTRPIGDLASTEHLAAVPNDRPKSQALDVAAWSYELEIGKSLHLSQVPSRGSIPT